MRGTKAKRVRREVYGEYSQQASARKYEARGKTVVATSFRRRYQEAKRER